MYSDEVMRQGKARKEEWARSKKAGQGSGMGGGREKQGSEQAGRQEAGRGRDGDETLTETAARA